MNKPNYNEKWFQALVLMCTTMSIFYWLSPPTPDPDHVRMASNMRDRMAWIMGPFFFALFYLFYGVVHILHFLIRLIKKT